MDVYRNLELDAAAEQMAALADQVEQAPPAGWVRDRAAEDRIRAAPVLAPRPAFCFTCAPDDRHPAATLILTPGDPATYCVSNILPIAGPRLTLAEYNAVLEDFHARVLQPRTGPAGIPVTLTSARADLESWMSPETAEKLRRFSATAHRGTGSAHPRDRDRWHDFVLAAHRDGSGLDAADLRRWLTESQGWPPEVAEHLAAEYDYGRQLLAFADGRRRSA